MNPVKESIWGIVGRREGLRIRKIQESRRARRVDKLKVRFWRIQLEDPLVSDPQNLRILGRAEGSEDLDHFLANPQHYFADPKFKQELISLVDKYAKKLELGKYAVREDLEFSDEPLDLSMRKRDNEEARPADKPSYSVEELLKIKKRWKWWMRSSESSNIYSPVINWKWILSNYGSVLQSEYLVFFLYSEAILEVLMNEYHWLWIHWIYFWSLSSSIWSFTIIAFTF